MSIIALDRTCYELNDKGERTSSGSVPVTDLLTMPAWVLLGEPGMGKTTTLKQLGSNDERCYVRARDLSVKTAEDFHDSQIILIDGLDEFGDNLSVRNKLAQLARDGQLASIGISSRYADWFQKRDHPDFKAVHPSLRVFVLEPLSEPQTLALAAHFLNAEQSTQDAKAFTEQAQHLGLGAMLANPQLMTMLVKAIVRSTGDTWPKSRREVYVLACKEMLREHNPNHELTQDYEGLLYAAGELCAIYLLSQSAVICTHEEAGSGASSKVDISNLPNTQASKALWCKLLGSSKLFIKTNEYIFEPIHRTVAEYLAARYLAERVQSNLLSFNRVAALLLAQDGGVVANLRGLVGQLGALLTDSVQQKQMIDADPEALLNYGDLSALSEGAKQTLLTALERTPHRAYVSPEVAVNFVPLVDHKMSAYILQYLTTTKRNESANTQAHLLCSALAHIKQIEPQIQVAIENIVRDATWNEHTRRQAIRVLIRAAADNMPTLLPWLDAIAQERIEDHNRDLRAELLMALYPTVVTPARVFDFYVDSTSGYLGWNWGFWNKVNKGLEQQPDQVVLDVANGLIRWLETEYIKQDEHQRSALPSQLDGILTIAILKCGDLVPIPTLTTWIKHTLTRGHGYGSPHLELKDQLQAWMNSHETLIQQVQIYWYEQAKEPVWRAEELNRLLPLPEDLCAWYLSLADHFYAQQDSAKVRYFIERSVAHYGKQPTKRIYPEELEAWFENKSLDFQIDDFLICKWAVEDWRVQDNTFKQEQAAREREQEKSVNEQLKYLENDIADIENGMWLQALGRLAWNYVAANETSYFSNDWLAAKVFTAVQANPKLAQAFSQGFQACVHRLDAGTISQALASEKEKKHLLIMLPALLGMTLLHEQDQDAIHRLSLAQQETLLVFYFLSLIKQPTWLVQLIGTKPDLIAKAWLQVAQMQATAKADHISRLWEIANGEAYPVVAKLALPALLQEFPIKAAESQMSDFATLLLGCSRHMNREELVTTLKARLKKKSINALQRAYCLMLGFLLAPSEFESAMTQLLDARQIDIAQLMAFVKAAGFPHSGKVEFAQLTPQATAFCIRLFAPHCTPDHPSGAHYVTEVDATRDFIRLLLTHLENDTQFDAATMLQELGLDPQLHKWQGYFESALTRQIKHSREAYFKPASPQQIAKALVNTEPANHQDLLAIAIDQLSDLQSKLNGSELNYKNTYWHPMVEIKNGVKTKSNVHRDEEDCRDEIAIRLVDALSKFGISLVTEALQAKAKRSDIQLRHLTPTSPEMRLPIEIKGIWHRELWTAPEKQLVDQYMNHPDCNRLGIYLVLWTGEIEKMKHAFRKAFPNGTLPRNLDTFKQQMTNHIKANAACKGIELFVLDITR